MKVFRPSRLNRPGPVIPIRKLPAGGIAGLETYAVTQSIATREFRALETPSFLTPRTFPDFLMLCAATGELSSSFVFHLGFNILAVGASRINHEAIAAGTFGDALGLETGRIRSFLGGAILLRIDAAVLTIEVFPSSTGFYPAKDLAPVIDYLKDPVLLENGFIVLHAIETKEPRKTVISAAAKCLRLSG